MTELDKKILANSKGEHRLKPDEQRRYLGTYAERVVLTAHLSDAHLPAVRQHFPNILQKLTSNYDDLSVKLSSQLDTAEQMTYMKIAQTIGCATTIVDDSKANSPFGIVIHSNQPIRGVTPDIRTLYPKLFDKSKEKEDTPKSFWKQLFS